MNLTMASLFNVEILKDVQIFVVDNDLDSGMIYTIFLKQFGANVITTGSIKEALKVLTWFVPDILICEIRFLGENVYALFNKLAAMEAVNKNHIPILVTSTCGTGTVEQIPEIEFEGYLLKPIDLDKLVASIKNLVIHQRKIAMWRQAGEQRSRRETCSKSFSSAPLPLRFSADHNAKLSWQTTSTPGQK